MDNRLKRNMEAMAYYEDRYAGHTHEVYLMGIGAGVEWADKHPSDETIMNILNAMGYEDDSWVLTTD